MEHSTEIHLTITLARVLRTLGQGMQQCFSKNYMNNSVT